MPDRSRSEGVVLDGIAKSYGGKLVVDVPELTVAAGEFLTLLGPSGCGKTTLLMMLAGFVRPDRGTIRAGARDITALAPEKRNFGMVFQGYALFPHLTVRDNIAYPLRRRRMDPAAIARRVGRVLERVQLGALAARYPKQLSGGQQQRVALARAIVFDPDLILLDEPLSALDANLRQDLREELAAIHRETGTTFVFVTHDQDEALTMSDRIAVMRDGRIIQLGTPQALYRRPATRFVAGFMGAKNLLTMTVQQVRDGVATCTAQGRQLRQSVPAPVAPGATITVALRPNKIALGAGGHANEVRGAITSFGYMGSEIVVTLESEIGPLTVWHPAEDSERIALGAGVVAGWRDDAAVVVAEDD